ncbi:MAG: hypothetical protein ACM3XQ_04380, partial [Nocardioidaceae bacterium]
MLQLAALQFSAGGGFCPIRPARASVSKAEVDRLRALDMAASDPEAVGHTGGLMKFRRAMIGLSAAA